MTDRKTKRTVDVHSHFTTAPAALAQYRTNQLASLNKPTAGALRVSDGEIAEAIRPHLEQMDERGIAARMFSPTAAWMGHDVGDARVSRHWAMTNNDLIHRATELSGGRLIPVCQLPQSPGEPLTASVAELVRCVTELGFVGCNIDPDVAAGLQPFTPSLGGPEWYELWEAMIELDVPGMIHVSATRNPAFHLNGSHYIAHDYAAVVELCMSDVFERYPALRLVVPHGGGAMPMHYNRQRALNLAAGLRPYEEVLAHLYFDTAVYDRAGVELLLSTVDPAHVLFASEPFGTGNVVDPDTGRLFDDNRAYVQEAPGLDAAQRDAVLWGNALTVYPRAANRLHRALGEEVAA